MRGRALRAGAAGRCTGVPADPARPTPPVKPVVRAARPQEPHDHARAPLHCRVRGREAAPGQAGACEPSRSAHAYGKMCMEIRAWRSRAKSATAVRCTPCLKSQPHLITQAPKPSYAHTDLCGSA